MRKFYDPVASKVMSYTILPVQIQSSLTVLSAVSVLSLSLSLMSFSVLVFTACMYWSYLGSAMVAAWPPSFG